MKPPIESAGAIHDEAAAKAFAELQEAKTPDFSDGQIYLNAAPEGIDARYSWTVPGGSGEGVNIIDIEGGWNFNHEDLSHNKGGLIGGVNFDDHAYIDHRTAVLGEIGGDRSGFGVTGICPNARISAVSAWRPERVFDDTFLAPAIKFAADRLHPGDIMLLEFHERGPRYNFTRRSDEVGYIAVEWWPDIYVANAQGWGREVTTTGYGYLWKGPSDLDNISRWYTDRFNGTSSATPIVVGALACVQGVLRKHRRKPIKPCKSKKAAPRNRVHSRGCSWTAKNLANCQSSRPSSVNLVSFKEAV